LDVGSLRAPHQLGYFERLEELLHYSNDHQLRLVCEWGLTHGPMRSGVVGTDAAAAAARKRKRGVHAGSGGGGGSSSDSDREENTPGREKKPKKILHVAAATATATAATNATGDGEQAAAAEERQVSGQHNGARRGSKSSRSRRRRDEQAAAAAAELGGGGRDGEQDGDEPDSYEMDLESRMPPGKQVTLNFADRTNFIKLSADCYEVRNDSASFGSIRANCYVYVHSCLFVPCLFISM
jgi:hypothetical protein